MRTAAFLLMTILAALTPQRAAASNCFLFSEGDARVWNASTSDAQVRVTYIGHSTFRLETAAGVTIATDFAGWAGKGDLPDVVTMNHAHETHFTDYPDPEIKHVLRGWNPKGDGPAEHYLEVEDVIIRNVPTNIRGWDGGTEYDGNSIFIFEVADLCIGHLGHLHHELEPKHISQIGRLDVVFAPVDGGMTLDTQAMVSVLKDLRAKVVIPMHYFGRGTLEMFLDGMKDDFQIAPLEEPVALLSRATLPATPTILILPGY